MREKLCEVCRGEGIAEEECPIRSKEKEIPSLPVNNQVLMDPEASSLWNLCLFAAFEVGSLLYGPYCF